MANLSKASNVVQEKYILYEVTGFTQKCDSCRNQLYLRGGENSLEIECF